MSQVDIVNQQAKEEQGALEAELTRLSKLVARFQASMSQFLPPTALSDDDAEHA